MVVLVTYMFWCLPIDLSVLHGVFNVSRDVWENKDNTLKPDVELAASRLMSARRLQPAALLALLCGLISKMC